MFAADARTLSRIEPSVRRVIIADPNMASARLLLDIMKSLGAREVVTLTDEARVMEAIREIEPGLIFTERTGPRLDGESLTRKLRRSNLAARRAPVIMVTGDATASSIKGARDSGVHEFLRKPFTSADLFKRVENVALKPRDWIEAVQYVGPDRRRFNSADYKGPRKRKADAKGTVAARLSQALRIVRSAAQALDSDPHQARRALAAQAVELRKVGDAVKEPRLVAAAAALEDCMKSELSGPLARAELLKRVDALMGFMAADDDGGRGAA